MVTLEPIEVQRARCEEYRDLLHDLTRIHLEIDPPTREVGAEEPDWVFRLRKVCLHAVAITDSVVDIDGVHVMTTELRAAYEQMDAIWKCLPDEFRFNEDGSWWASQARDGLATYNHPTMFSLLLPLMWGGFDDSDAPESHLRLALWLGRLACGYGLALARLAQLLGTEEDIASRLQAVASCADGSVGGMNLGFPERPD